MIFFAAACNCYFCVNALQTKRVGGVICGFIFKHRIDPPKPLFGGLLDSTAVGL